jgi:hypothetical protein
MAKEEQSHSKTSSNNLVKNEALADAYIEFKSIRSYELKRSKFKGSVSMTKTDQIVINNEICQYINLDRLFEAKLNQFQSSDSTSHIDGTPEIVSKQKSSVKDKDIVAAMFVAALFFLVQYVLGDPVAIVTSFMVVMGYFVCNVDIAIK